MHPRSAPLLVVALGLGCADRSGVGFGDDAATTDTVDAGDTDDASDTSTTNTTNTTNDSDPTGLDDGWDDTDSDPDTCETLELAVTSDCIIGEAITSVDYANERCAADLGEEWRWLEFHATWGWSVEAQIDPEAWPNEERAWVWIDDQDAECFSSSTREITEGEPERFGMTWGPVETNDNCVAANCNSQVGLDEPGLDPIDNDPSDSFLQCNPYDGDTPCSRCRPLLCVRDI